MSNKINGADSTATAVAEPKTEAQPGTDNAETQSTKAQNAVVDDGSKQAEDAMNATQLDEEDPTKPKGLPENEYNFYQEIIKNPVEGSDDLFTISKEAPKAAFKGRGSPKTLAQTSINKLILRGIIERVERGGAQKRAVVRVLNRNVEMSNEGRGRKVNVTKAPKQPRVTTTRAPREKAAKRSATATPAQAPQKRGPRTSLTSIFSKMFVNIEDVNAFQEELRQLEANYPQTWHMFLKTLRNNTAA